MRLTGKRALVTGGGSGIGLATVGVLRREGAEVISAGLEDGIDLTADGAARELLDRVGAIDILVLNAGICRPASLLDTTSEEWRRTIDVNLSAVFWVLQEAGRRRVASIVLTASTNSFDGEADLIAYNASKAGLLGLLHTAANELGPYGVRVNAVCPGLIRTPLTENAFEDPQFTKAYFQDIPLGRGGEASEVAEAIAFLVSPQASFITGTALVVDGGQMAAKFGTWGKEGDEFVGGRWRRKG